MTYTVRRRDLFKALIQLQVWTALARALKTVPPRPLGALSRWLGGVCLVHRPGVFVLWTWRERVFNPAKGWKHVWPMFCET